MEDRHFECSICGTETGGFGNNPEPFKGEKCCDDCDDRFVVPTRLCLGRGFKDESILNLIQTIAELGVAMRRVTVESLDRWADEMSPPIKRYEDKHGE